MKIKPAETIEKAKSVRRKRRSNSEVEIDYRKIPGIVILDTDAALFNWTVFGTKTAPKKED